MPQYDCIIIEATDYFFPGQLSALEVEIYDYIFCYLADSDIPLKYIKDDFEKRTGLCADKVYKVATDTDAYKGIINLSDDSYYIYPCIKIDGEEVSITGFYINGSVI